MDISVRRLNHRLALQLPKELPLGLVFVMGTVGEVQKPVVVEVGDDHNGRIEHKHIEFELLEEGYNLRCLLTQSVDNPTTVWEGETVRVGGHLTFDPRYADYFLMTHDVEIIIEEEEVEPLFSDDSLALVHEQEALAEALAGVKRRSQSFAQLESAELPIWVQKIAPLEIQKELGIEVDENDAEGEPEIPYDSGELTSLLPDEMVSDLSDAMDGDKDVVITTGLLSNYVGDEAEALGSTVSEQPKNGKSGETAVSVTTPAPDSEFVSPVSPTPVEDIHETDWLVILLIIAFVVMTIVLIIATITLIAR